ncbi:hypothetical protein CCMA1212_001520 [Trichoderma ghanense]|uniref:Secreted protein n=1 Tax=Trichoderma ghanense TaxID=65468 RepID=A0ABY2HDS8_9HYPO
MSRVRTSAAMSAFFFLSRGDEAGSSSSPKYLVKEHFPHARGLALFFFPFFLFSPFLCCVFLLSPLC